MSNSEEIIKIDGGYLEGGGQILRTACALSAITQKPCHIFNIRQSRPKPGLMPQHLLGIQALAHLCDGKLDGDFFGSKEIKFYPQKIRPQNLNVKIGTAASVTLILQTLIPAALCAEGNKSVKITLDGGAFDTFFSPTFDYFQYVFLKILEKIGAKIEINILQRGYYPEGKAKLEITISPLCSAEQRAEQINFLERGELRKILVISGASEFLKNKKVAERQIMGVKEILGKLKLPFEEKIEYYPTQCPGSQICLIAEFADTIIGTDNLGKLGKRAEDVGKEAALDLLKEQKSRACLDKHMADQILPYLALLGKKNSAEVSEITNHCKTNILVIEKFLPGKFQIKNNLISWYLKQAAKFYNK